MRLRALRIMGAMVLGMLVLGGIALAAEPTSTASATSSSPIASPSSTAKASATAPASSELAGARAVTAAPGSPLKFVTVDSPKPVFTGAEVVANCPGGHQPISGGFDVHRQDTPWTIFESRPSGNGWKVGAATLEQNPKPFTAYAVCAPESLVPRASIDYPTRTEQVPAGRAKELTPDCRPSYKAIGGGFRLGSGALFLVRSQPNPGNGFRSWIVSASALPQRTGDLSAYSVCVKEDLVRGLRFFQGEATDRNVINADTERCPQGTYLLGGGGGTNERNAPYIYWSHMRPGVGTQAEPPSTWSAGAIKAAISGAPAQITLNSHAMCGRLGPEVLDNPLKYVMADSSLGTGDVLKAVAQCPNSYQAISGGFDLHRDTTPWTIRASRPATDEEASKTGWVVQAASPGFTSRPFTAYAVCVNESLVPEGGRYYTSSSVDLPHDRLTRELTPDCRPSHQAIGGGFAIETIGRYSGTSIRIIRSQPNPGGDFSSWIVRAGNGALDTDAKFSAYSVCIQKGLVNDLQFLDHPESSTGVINSTTPSCPENTYLLSGGGGASTPDSNWFDWSHIRPGGGSEADPPKIWSAGAIDTRLVKISNLTVHAHALCGRLGSENLGGGGGKLSGKNRGWGDGMGGGRFK